MAFLRDRALFICPLIGVLGALYVWDSDRRAAPAQHLVGIESGTCAKSKANGAGSPVYMACCAPDGSFDCQSASGLQGRSVVQVGDTHWLVTTLDGSNIPIGTPVRVTYSFAPDGATVGGAFGFAGLSNLFEFMNELYVNPSVWQPIFDEVLDRFEEISGVTFVYEPNDDGAEIYVFPGEWGDRGDIRFAGATIDGIGGRLAQGTLPARGDIVIDTSDNFFDDTSGDSRRLRNLLAHEIGHALGLVHACPQDGTKIMEPTLNLGFNGPQHDEFRQVQFRYGDDFEPNDSPVTATDLGDIPVFGSAHVGPFSSPPVTDSSRLSIRSASDQDYFRFATLEAVTITITAQPLGRTYPLNAGTCGVTQTDCCTGGIFDSQSQADIGLEFIDTDGVTVIASATSQPEGAAEVIDQQVVLTAGDYYVRVFPTNAPLETQMYELTIALFDPPNAPLRIFLPDGVPEMTPAGLKTDINVRIDPGDESLVPGSELLHYRADGGAFVTSPLTSIGGLDYVATLPAANCGQTPEYFLSATGTINGITTQPSAGAASPFALILGQDIVELDDDFETDQGWTVQNDPQLSDGAWERGTPVGGGNRGDPPTDFDSSGQCYLTDPLDGNTDVDDGRTWLISPSFDLADGDTTISYAVWYRNDTGSDPNEDLFVVAISNDDGANWTPVQTLGPITQPGWVQNTILVSDFVTPTATVRLRFEASDLINPSVVEAGVDAVRIVHRTCIPPLWGDFDGDGDVDSVDYGRLADCWAGPLATPAPPPPTTTSDCLNAFDIDADDDVDAFDVGKFQTLFTGP